MVGEIDGWMGDGWVDDRWMDRWTDTLGSK